IAKGLVERIGIDGSRLKQTCKEKELIIEEPMNNHTEAVNNVFKALTDENSGAIKNLNEIDAVGHRFVHGGEEINDSVIIDEKVVEAVKKNTKFAPLHNPANLQGLEACQKLLPDVKNVAVFDTAFHQSIPEHNYLYGIDYKYYEKYGIRKYGFHGTSHKYISLKASEVLGIEKDNLNIISCHLGNGASITAIKNGKSFDTTMGLTPLEGLVMGTRSGDLDPAVVTFIQNQEKISADEVNEILNKKSGVLGVSGISSDMRDLEDAREKGDKRAIVAWDLFATRAKRYIAGYMAELGRVDAIVFTGGIGENSDVMRKSIMEGFEQFGIEIDEEKNSIRTEINKISSENSSVDVYVIATNEELMIARDTMNLVKN
ncbi:MAG: acetate kinase, partial [Peptoniphilaceae bacterium]|nr:acetate kinase [Peptoniphilaceae bacterium]